MERFEFHDLFTVPRFTLKADAVAEFCVEREHVEVHLLTIDDINGVVHVLDKHFIGVTCRVRTDKWLGLRRSIAFLSAVFPFAVFTFVAVHGVHAFFRYADNRCCQQFVKTGGEGFA